MEESDLIDLDALSVAYAELAKLYTSQGDVAYAVDAEKDAQVGVKKMNPVLFCLTGDKWSIALHCMSYPLCAMPYLFAVALRLIHSYRRSVYCPGPATEAPYAVHKWWHAK